MKIYKRTKINKDIPFVANIEYHHKDGTVTKVTKEEWFAMRTKQFEKAEELFNHHSQPFLDAL